MCIALLGAKASGQAAWESLTLPDTVRAEEIAGLHFRDGSRGTLLTGRGVILSTSDGGRLWAPPASRGNILPPQTFTRVHFPHPDIGYALGSILTKSVDGGATWDSLGPVDRNKGEKGVYFVDRDTGYIVGGNPGDCLSGGPCTYESAVYRKTRDGGRTWKTEFLSSWPMITVGCADAWNCFSAGYRGKLFRINRFFTDSTTEPIASRLDNLSTGTSQDLMGIDFPDPTTGYVVGGKGTILKTEDGGRQWHPLISGSPASLRAAAFLDSQRGFVAGDSGTLLYTFDGGLSWTLQPKLTDRRLTSLECPSQDTCFASGDQGTLLRMTRGLHSPILRRVVRPSDARRAGMLRWEISRVGGPAADLRGRRMQAHGRASGIAVLPPAP